MGKDKTIIRSLCRKSETQSVPKWSLPRDGRPLVLSNEFAMLRGR